MDSLVQNFDIDFYPETAETCHIIVNDKMFSDVNIVDARLRQRNQTSLDPSTSCGKALEQE